MKTKEVPETNLDGLIQRIKKEGIEEAKTRSDEVIREAGKRASELIEQAKGKAETILKEAKEEIEKRDSIAKKALDQAARDVILSVREALIDMFGSIIKKECKEVFSGKALERILLTLIEGWQKDKDGDLNLEVLLSEAERSELSEIFLSKLKKKMKSGIELKVQPEIEGGFHVGIKGGNFYYDFTDEGIAAILAPFLSQELSAIVDPVRKRQKAK